VRFLTYLGGFECSCVNRMRIHHSSIPFPSTALKIFELNIGLTSYGNQGGFRLTPKPLIDRMNPRFPDQTATQKVSTFGEAHEREPWAILTPLTLGPRRGLITPDGHLLVSEKLNLSFLTS